MPYKCISEFTVSGTSSASPNSHDPGLQVHLWVHWISASKCISTLARSPPPSASLSSFDLGLPVHRHTCSITATKCIIEFNWSQSQSASPNSPDSSLQVHLLVHSISVSKCISTLARSWPPSASLNTLNRGLQVHLNERRQEYRDTGVMEGTTWRGVYIRHTPASVKCHYVTGSLWQCLRVVGPESQGGRIPELTGPTLWPSSAPGSTWERRRQDWECQLQAWEHLGVRTTNLGAPATTLGAPRITVEQYGRNNIFFGNTAGAPDNHSYYLSFNDV